MTSLRRDSPKQGNLVTVAGSVNSPVITGQKQGNKSGLMSVQHQSAGQGQGGQLRTGLQRHSLGCSKGWWVHGAPQPMAGGPMEASQGQ